MSIESANLSPTTPSGVTVAGVSPPLVDGSVVAEGFSGALVAQIELLTSIKAADSSSPQTSDITGSKSVSGAQVVAGLATAKVDTQDFAALLGNDLPASYKTKDDVDHEAALVAVTNTFKYLAGPSVGEKMAEAEQNVKDVTAMTVPLEQNKKGIVAMTVPVEQNTTDAGVEAAQSMKDGVLSQMDLKRTTDKLGKKEDEDETKVSTVEGSRVTDELLAATIILPTSMPVDQAKVANSLTPAGVIKGDTLLSFVKPSTGNTEPNQPTKIVGDALQGGAVFRQPVQDKQGFNLKYVESSGQAEKALRVDGQLLSMEGEKALPRVGVDTTPLNRLVVDNKTDVPAMTKPLSHPDWSKDLGERIVWMNSRAIPAAEIRLNPQHLGPISVRVDVADDRATVVFTAQHAAVREVLEASIPKLREMMSSQQLDLVDVTVSQGSASDQGRSQSQNFAQNFSGGRGQGAAGAVADGVEEVEQEIDSGRAVVSKGLLSIYA